MATTIKKKKPAAAPRVRSVRAAVARPAPRDLDIASRAYELFLQRGGEHGRDWEDWLMAEQELKGAAS